MIAETLMKIVTVVVEIFGEMGRFLQISQVQISHTSMSGVFWTKVHAICTRSDAP